MIIEAIKRALDSQGRDRDPKIISASSLGQCSRKLAFRHHGYAEEPLDWRAKAIFSDGNHAHDQLREWIRSGLDGTCYTLDREELRVERDKIGGHIDGAITHNPECKVEGHKTRLLEIKSMNSYSFSDLEKESLPDYEYLIQIYFYLYALDLEECILLAKNKNNSVLYESIITLDKEELLKRINTLNNVIKKSDNPTSVQREFGPDKRGNLDWHCGYCPFWKHCWAAEGVEEWKPHKLRLSKPAKTS